MNALNERVADLIQADVDGMLQEDDREELEAALEESMHARAFHQEMQQLTNLLEQIPDLDPPADLHRRILDSIELPPVRQLPAWLRSWFQPVSYGLAVAAGMLITVGMVNILPGQDMEMTSLVGSMVKQEDALPKASQGQLGLDLEAIQGAILLKNLDGTLALQFDLVSAEPVEIQIDLAEAGLLFGGFAHESEGLSIFEASGGSVRLLNQGAQQFVVFLRKADDSKVVAKDLGVTISQDDLRIFQGYIAFEG